MRKYFYIIANLAPVFLFSQYSIKGTIQDQETGTGLEQVSVYFPQLERGSVTDASGAFEIKNIPLGKHKLIASLLGYETYSATLELLADMNPITIQLKSSAIEMEEVIVSTPFHKLQRENVMKVEQAPVKELRRNGAVTLADGIRQLPGVETLSTGVGIGKPVIRGLSSNRVVVYTQGIRLENQQFGDEHGLGIGDGGIESVEVIKGPASLLYGSDALGGVLYLNPERYAPSGTTKANLRSQYYSATLGSVIQGGASLSGASWKFLSRLSRSSHADYKDGAGTRVTNTRFGEWDFKSGLSYASGRFNNDLRYNYVFSKPGIPEEMSEQSRDRTPLLPYQEITSHIISNSAQWFLPTSSIKFVLGYVANNRLEFEEHHHDEEEEEVVEEEEEGPALDMQLNTLNYNLQHQFSLADSKVQTVLGIQGMWQENSNAGEEVLIPDAKIADVGVMGTSHIHLNASDIQFGLRYDHRDLKGQESGDIGTETYIQALHRNFGSFNTALGYRVNINPNFIGRLNLASGFRAPNLSELLSNGPHSGANRFEIGNPDFINERNLQWDASLEFKGEHMEFGLNVFRNRVRDFIYLAPTGDVFELDPVYQYLQEDALLYGGEAAIHIHPHPLDWLHFQSNASLVIGQLDNNTNLPLIPPFRWSNTLRLEFDSLANSIKNSYFFAGLESYFRQDRVSEFETETPAYKLINLGFGGESLIFGYPMELQLAVTNVFDVEYISHLSRLKPDGILNIGRNITFGVNINL
jgi:iron complex outermembrane recepter protein